MKVQLNIYIYIYIIILIYIIINFICIFVIFLIYAPKTAFRNSNKNNKHISINIFVKIEKNFILFLFHFYL